MLSNEFFINQLYINQNQHAIRPLPKVDQHQKSCPYFKGAVQRVDPTELNFILKAYKERGAEVFRKLWPSPILRAL